MKPFLLLSAIIIFSNLIYTQELIHPPIPGDRIKDIEIINDKEILFVNEAGAIYKSYNGGEDWVRKEYFQDYKLTELHFVDEKRGFARADSYNSSSPNSLISTLDGGETWQEQEISIESKVPFLPVAENVLLKSGGDGIYLLDNFFDDWKRTYEIPIHETDYGTQYPISRVEQFLIKNDGSILALIFNQRIIYGEKTDTVNFILESHDNGYSWDTLSLQLPKYSQQLVLSNDSTGWLVSYDALFKSTDGCRTWKFVTSAYIYDLYADASIVYYLTNTWDHNKLLLSTDGGNSWYENNQIGINNAKLAFKNQKGWLYDFQLSYSSDNGRNWKQVIREFSSISDISFLSNMTGFYASSGGLYKTYDGGKNWQVKVKDGGMKIKMTSENTGYFLCSQHIYKTTNGGKSWDSLTFPHKSNYYYFTDMNFYNENFGILSYDYQISDSGISKAFNEIYITNNGGESWELRSDYVYKMRFAGSTDIWAFKDRYLIVSKDSALTWTNILPVNSYRTLAYDFFDPSTGIIVTDDIYSLTTDGGNTWISRARKNYAQTSDVKILSKDSNGYLQVVEAGKNGYFAYYLIKPDGGIETYFKYPSYTKNDFSKIEVYFNKLTPSIWVAGDGESILYLNELGTGVNDPDNKPQEFSLLQNYPNPFNPSTTISYTLPSPAFVSLKVYDILGQEISTLISEDKPSGTYKNVFNASGLSSGIYFYNLRAGEYSQTRKMILIK